MNTKKSSQDLRKSEFNGQRYLKAPGASTLEDAVHMVMKQNPAMSEQDVRELIEYQLDAMGDTGTLVIPTDVTDPALVQTDVVRIPADTTTLIKESLRKTSPTDEILVSDKMLNKLSNFWENPNEKKTDTSYIPADIFWADTIPIKDCIIRNPNYEKLRRETGDRSVKYARVAIIEDPVKAAGHVCGVISLHYDDETYYTTFGLGDVDNDSEALNKLEISKAVGLLYSESQLLKIGFYKNKYFFNSNSAGLFYTMMQYLYAWYGIQIALLNPHIEFVFKESSTMSAFEMPQNSSRNSKNKKNKKKPSKIKYVKRYTITDQVFDDAMKQSYVYKKLSWYVTGHWRWQATKDGHKRIFIQGYWKGVARNTKQTDIRERSIVSKKENDDE